MIMGVVTLVKDTFFLATYWSKLDLTLKGSSNLLRSFAPSFFSGSFSNFDFFENKNRF